jgi:Icc protein
VIRILQVTDSHLFAKPGVILLGVDTDATFSAVLDAGFNAGQPDVVLLTGDIAQAPDDEVYRRVARELESRHKGPMMWVAGNHDLSTPFAKSRYSQSVLELGAWTILGVDTHVDDETDGHVTADEMHRLERAIEDARGTHILVVGHHHPVPINTIWLDSQRIDNGDALVDLMAASGRVRGYVFGHIHQPFDMSVDGVRVLGTPSSCFQFAPGGEKFAVESPSLPGFRWLELAEDGNISTDVGRLEWSVEPNMSGVRY